MFVPFIGDVTLLSLFLLAVGLIILWVIVSIPVYIAGKFVTAGDSSLGDAMIATLFGPIVYVVTLFIVQFVLGAFVASGAYIWALVIAFIAWVGVFKASFKTSWFRALAIALLAILVFAGLSLVFGALLGVMVPAPFFPRL